MAISRVSGNILQDDLQRGTNLSIQGNLIYFDVTNNRVGVRTSAPEDEFNVVGVANASNVRITSATANGIFYANAGLLASTSSDFTWDGTTVSVTGNITANSGSFSETLSIIGNLTAGNIASNAEISAVTAAILGNIDAGNIATTGNITAVGNIEGGNIISDGAVIGNVTIGGNLTVANLTVTDYFTGNYVNISNTVTASGNITGQNIIANGALESSTASVTGNTSVGNLVIDSTTAGQILYTDLSNNVITNANLLFDGSEITLIGTANIVGNISAIDISLSGNLTAAGNVTGEYLVANSAVIGNVSITDLSVGNIDATGYANISGNLQGGNISTANLLAAGNITVASLFSNQVVYVNATGILATSSNLVFDGSDLSLDGSLAWTNVTINGTSITSSANITISSSANANIQLIPNGDGVVQIVSTTALTVPVGNTAQRPASPDQGAVRFNTINLELEVWDGTQWETVGADIAVITDQTLNGDGITVNFVLDQETYANSIIVSTNGVVQKPNVSYTVAGNLLTFAEAPAISDLIDVRFIAEVEQVTAISNSAGNASIQVDPSGVGNLSTVKSVQLPAYSVAQATALSNTANGQIIYVSDGNSGAPCLAVYSVDAWKIVALGGNITA